jgi:hypothetical protein
MTVSGGNVITTLQDRWRIDQDIQELLQVRSQQEFTSRAQSVAARGEQVISVILQRLDHADARSLSALGIISSLYPQREQILNKLYGAAADLDRPDRGRVSAMLILERFLGQEPDPYLISTLDNPQFMAVESIKEMIREGERDPRALLEYTRTLAEQADETIEGVIDTLIEIGQERAVPALCLLAQDDNDTLGRAALLALGRLHHPDAAQGLQSILPLLSPERCTWGERSLLKLRLKQVPISPRPPVDATWRTLVSPIDGEGSQVIWFVGEPNEHGLCRFVGFSINDHEGIRQVYGHVDVPADTLPARRLRGHVHNVALRTSPPDDGDRSPGEHDRSPGGHDRSPGEHGRSPGEHDRSPAKMVPSPGILLHMLESNFDYGRWLVREAQARNARQERHVPVEYRLFGPWLWQYDDAQVGLSRWQGLGPVRTAGRSGPTGTVVETATLLSHPAFRGWFAYGELVLQHAVSALQPTPLTVGSDVGSDLAVLARAYFDRGMISRLRYRLDIMSEWLWQAGDARTAALSTLAAETLSTTSPAEHPLTRRMIELGLRAAVEQLRHM